jgi:ubiquitin carboxyl-terminal hydrolase L3
MDRHYAKTFIPLESDPDIFTRLIHALGAPPSLCFEEVFSLDEPDFLPHPAHALILVFPTAENQGYCSVKENAEAQACGENEENVVWFRQTIHNACGLYGVLHALSNGTARTLLSNSHPLTSALYLA